MSDLKQKKEKIINIPNFLTMLRILVLPFFGYYLYTERFVTAAIIFVLAALTDILDGYLP